MTDRPPSRRALIALAAFGIGAIGLVACSGDEGPSGGTTTTATTATEAMQVPVFSDPSQLVTIDVGRRFAIVVPADPAGGWRWVVEPVDTQVLAPLGSEFREDPVLLASATTTTTLPPPPETTTTRLGDTTTSTVATTTTAPPPEETTTTTAPGPLVQIVSYAGRADGLAQITMRYVRIGTTPEDTEEAQTLTFQVVVGTFSLPEPPPSVPPED